MCRWAPASWTGPPSTTPRSLDCLLSAHPSAPREFLSLPPVPLPSYLDMGMDGYGGYAEEAALAGGEQGAWCLVATKGVDCFASSSLLRVGHSTALLFDVHH